jgi:D-alanyl-D-alanine carboxypeptidase (penicillin-binding protein 5/6)
LTKIMTAYVVLKLIEKHKLDADFIKVNILESSTTPLLGGTSAELLANDKLTVSELMYGMMLPSGNDAA